MKNIVKNKKLMIGFLTFVFLLATVIGVLLKPNKAITAHGTEVTQNTELNVNEVRIDGWRALRDMTVFGGNNDYGCGMNALRFRPNAKTLALISVGLN